MPVQNYGAIMQGAADLTAMPANAFAQGQQRRQAQEYRNSLLGMDQQRLAMDQQKFDADQEDDEEDRALYAAWAKQDWATADAIDPVSTMGYRMKQEELKKLQTPEAPKRDIRAVGGSLLEVPQEGDPRVLYQAPERPNAPTDAPADQRLYEWFSGLTPDKQAAFLNMKRSSATPEAAASIATAKTTATEKAKATVAAQGDLPRVEGNASDMRNVLKQLKTHKGTRFIVGGYSIAPPVPGTPQADAYALWEQVQGKAFLEAFNSLKGGGQITEKEGEKATAAITRLSNRRQSLESFQKAIKDLEDVVSAGEGRARTKAGQGGTKRLKFDQNGDPVQ
jgi:hypothetical protein